MELSSTPLTTEHHHETKCCKYHQERSNGKDQEISDEKEIRKFAAHSLSEHR
jgi:hypothetical protein